MSAEAVAPVAKPPVPVLPIRNRRRTGLSDNQFAWALMAPAAVFLAIFVTWPVVKLIIDSFFDVDALAGTREFVGIGNYAKAFASQEFLDAAVRTVGYTVLVVAAEFVLGLATALLFNALGDRSRVLRTIFLYPLMIAPVVAGLLWRFLLIDNFGIVGALLARIGGARRPQPDRLAQQPGHRLVLRRDPRRVADDLVHDPGAVRGLQNLPGDVIEAARLDGVGGWRLLTRIMIQLLRPVIAVALIVRGVDAAKAFDVILIQTNGGPEQASTTLSLLIYQTMVRLIKRRL